MKKIKLFLFLLLLLTIFSIGNRNLMASVEKTYDFTDKDWKATSDGTSANWTSKIAGNGYSNSGIQATTGAKACGNSPDSFTNIIKVVVTYCTNASSGSGTIAVRIVDDSSTPAGQGTLVEEKAVTSSGGTSGRTLEYNVSYKTGYIQIQGLTSDKSIYIISVTITYNATVEKKTVQFKNENGEDFNPSIASIEVNKGASIGTLPTVPGKTGYRFDGWYDSLTGGNKVESDTPITDSLSITNNVLTLYARYLDLVTVSFDSKGGSAVLPIDLAKGNKVTKPLNPTRTGYVFDYWYLNNETEPFDFEDPIEQTMTLNAKWILESLLDFQALNTQASMNFSYRASTTSSTKTIEFNSTSTGNQTSGSDSVLKTNLDPSLFSVIPYTNSGNQVYFGSSSNNNDGVVKLHGSSSNRNGSSIVFEAIGTNKIIKSFKVTIHSGTNANGELSIYIEDKETAEVSGAKYNSSTPENNEHTYTSSTGISSFTLKNTSSTNSNAQLWVKISITYEADTTSYTLSSTNLRFGALIPAAVYDAITSEYSNVKFGVEINGTRPIDNEGKTINFNPVLVTIGENNYYQFAVVIPVPSDMLHEELTANVYMEIGEGDDAVKYYMQEVKYSFVTLAQGYLNSSDPAIKEEIADHKSTLNYIATLPKPVL